MGALPFFELSTHALTHANPLGEDSEALPKFPLNGFHILGNTASQLEAGLRI